MDIPAEDGAPVEVTHITTECSVCQEPAEFDIPTSCKDATVIFEPPCGHKTAHPNPHAAAPEADAEDDGTEHVGLADAGSGAEAAG